MTTTELIQINPQVPTGTNKRNLMNSELDAWGSSSSEEEVDTTQARLDAIDAMFSDFEEEEEVHTNNNIAKQGATNCIVETDNAYSDDTKMHNKTDEDTNIAYSAPQDCIIETDVAYSDDTKSAYDFSDLELTSLAQPPTDFFALEDDFSRYDTESYAHMAEDETEEEMAARVLRAFQDIEDQEKKDQKLDSNQQQQDIPQCSNSFIANKPCATISVTEENNTTTTNTTNTTSTTTNPETKETTVTTTISTTTTTVCTRTTTTTSTSQPEETQEELELNHAKIHEAKVKDLHPANFVDNVSVADNNTTLFVSKSAKRKREPNKRKGSLQSAIVDAVVASGDTGLNVEEYLENHYRDFKPEADITSTPVRAYVSKHMSLYYKKGLLSREPEGKAFRYFALDKKATTFEDRLSQGLDGLQQATKGTDITL